MLLGLFCFFTMVGYCAWQIIARVLNFHLKEAILLVPFYALVGISLTELIFYILCLIHVSILVVNLYVLSFFLLFLVTLYKPLTRRGDKKDRQTQEEPKEREIGFLVVFSVTLLVIAFIISRMGCSPPGDAIVHNETINLIIANGQFPRDHMPVSERPYEFLLYPQGFRALGVFTAFLVGDFSLYTSLLLVGVISILIPSIVFCTVLIRTKSIALGLMGFFISVIIPGGVLSSPYEANDLILGNLFGTYPQHLAMCQIIGYFCVVNWLAANDLTKNARVMTGMAVFFGLAIICSHYAHTFFALAFVGIVILKHGYSWLTGKLAGLEEKKKKGWQFFLVLTVCVSILGIGLIYIFTRTVFQGIINQFASWTSGWTTAYLIAPQYFLATFFGITISLGVGLWVYRAFREKKIGDTTLVFGIITVPVLVSAFVPEMAGLIFILPARCVMAAAAVAIISIMVNIQWIWGEQRHETREKVQKMVKLPPHRLKQFVSVTFLALVLTQVPAYRDLSTRYWLPQRDLTAIEWMNRNIPKEALILNDPSFEGLYLTSLEFRNVVFLRILAFSESDVNTSAFARRADRSLEIYRHPTNLGLIRSIITEYNISYIHVSPTNYFFDYFRGVYRQKTNYTSAAIIEAFRTNPLLDLRFLEDDTAIFEVIRHELGIYDATYSFQEDPPNGRPQDWFSSSAPGTDIRVLEWERERSKIVRMQDYSPVDKTYLLSDFSDLDLQNGTIELWVNWGHLQNSVGNLYLFEGESSSAITKFWIGPSQASDCQAELCYWNGSLVQTGYTVVQDVWYHFRLSFNCTTDTVEVCVNDHPIGSVQVEEMDSIGVFEILTPAYPQGTVYIDAVGYSWDPDYGVGDNKIPIS